MLRIARDSIFALAGLLLVVGSVRAADAPDAQAVAKAKLYSLSLLKEPRFQAPVGWQWGYFKNADGARLRYGWAPAAGTPLGTIAITPGFKSTAEVFFETARIFQAHGYDVWILDRRGQGGSDRWLPDREKAYSIGFDHEENDLAEFLTKIVRPRGPLFLVGESMGGHVGLRVLHDHPGIVRAAAFSSPAIDVHTGPHQGDRPKWIVRLAADVAVATGFRTDYGFGQHDWKFKPDGGNASDPAMDDPVRAHETMAWELKNPELREGGATWGMIYEMMRSSDLEQSAGYMAAIKTPVLLGETPTDELAVASVMVSSCRAMPHCRLVEFPGAKHALFEDRDATYNRLIAAILADFTASAK